MHAQGATSTLGSRLRVFLRDSWLPLIACVLILALVAAALVRGLVVQHFTVPSASMEPTLHAGDRITAWRAPALLETYAAGDIVVFDGRGSFVGDLPPDMFAQLGGWFGIGPRDVFVVKRVIATAGDTIQCCDDEGNLLRNGQAIVEPYLKEPGLASHQEFAAEVPPDRLWVMGDNRHNSQDSRSLLGRPGGGMIRTVRVVGVVSHKSSADSR